MKVNAKGVIENFVEKPAIDELDNWKSAVEERYAHEDKHYLASMGIYVFKYGILSKLFAENPKALDFGKEIIPYAVSSESYKTSSFAFGKYWTDIGTIASFFEANLRLTEFLPEFNLYDNVNRVYTNSRMLSPSKIFGTKLDHALIAGGSIIHASSITRSIIGVRSRIGKYTTIENAIIMGVDYYQTLNDLELNPDLKLLGIGEHCTMDRVIVDKNVRVGNHCVIMGGDDLEDIDTPTYCIRQGIIILRKGAEISDHTKIGAVPS